MCVCVFYIKESKRALSAPPTEVGKVVLQRMELKSPVTVRQTSVVPFEHAQNGAAITAINQNGEQIMLSAADTQSQQVPTQPKSYIDNPYNNRGVLRPSNFNGQPQTLALPQSQQVVPITRNVYLNRYVYKTFFFWKLKRKKRF